MPKYYVSTRSYNLGSHTPGRARGGTLEEPTAGNLHGGVREGRELTEPRLTYTRTKLETADRAKEDLKSGGSLLLGIEILRKLRRAGLLSTLMKIV